MIYKIWNIAWIATAVQCHSLIVISVMMWVSQIVSIVKSDQCHKLTESQKSPVCHHCYNFHGPCFVIVSCWSPQPSLPLRSIFRTVASVLGNFEVPGGYLGLGHLLSCHWQALNTYYWHKSPCLCQNNKKTLFQRITRNSGVSKAKASILQQER